MGQNQSTAFQHSSQPLFPRKSNPPPRPSAPPKIPPPPKTPSHIVPENKVLPNGVQDMSNARRLLRPVSQELTRFHPDFADIFQYDPEIDFQAGDDSAVEEDTSGHTGHAHRENGGPDLNASSHSAALSNGHASPVSSGPAPNGRVPTATSPEKHTVLLSNLNSPRKLEPATLPKVDHRPRPESATNLRRSQSVDRDRTPQMKMAKHKRQTSLTNGISIQENVIHEDPREHLYNVARHEPFSNYQPSTASLPLKSSFEMDYSMNLTYAQLAEYRRLKRVNELEGRTSKKLEDLGAEITASSTVPKSPFDRQNLGGKSSTHSISTGSSETGVSKSKKKKAPAPPPPGPPGREKSPSRFSLNTEPPADYDMDESSSPTSKRQSRPLQRSVSSASKSSKAPAPEPLARSLSTSVSSTVPSANIPPPPPLPESMVKAAAGKESDLGSTQSLPGYSSLQRSMSQAKAQLEALKKLEDTLKNPKPASETATASREPSSSPPANTDAGQQQSQKTPVIVSEVCDDNGNAITNKDTAADVSVAGPQAESHEIALCELDSQLKSNNGDNKPSASAVEGNSPFKRMSSLLQHDIILAAQARGSKFVKSKPPPALEKPKDASELFREELAKAASAREERLKESRSADSLQNSAPSTPREDKDKNIVFQSSMVKVSKKSPKTTNGTSISVDGKNLNETQNSPSSSGSSKVLDVKDKSKVPEDLEEEYLAAADSIDFTKRPSIQSEDMSISSSNASQRIFSPDWTPEHDLDSDDDIMDEHIVVERRVSSEGFKSSIIPPKITELKGDKKKKKKSQKKIERQESAEVPVDEKTKFGSIRKFKKSVHESVRNAFGSISKASGKLLKKQKSHEFLDVRETKLPSPTPESEDEELNSSKRSNWVFADNGKGSLRRTLSDGFIDQPYANGISESEYSDNSDDDIGDIDFADGINVDKKTYKNSNRTSKSEQKMKPMKRAGVAYVSQNGQIVVLPESQPVKSNVNGRVVDDDDGHAPKLFKKKNKKFSFQSTLKMQEKSRMEAAMAREIQEKEKQIEVERRKQQDMEKKFRRLRELDAQEMLQRMQTATMQEQITLLQQQQVRQAHNELNNNAISMPSLNNINSVSHSGSNALPTHYASNGHLPTSSCLINGSVGTGTSEYLMNSNQFSHAPPLMSQQRYSVPSFSTTSLGHSIPHASSATTPNPHNYTTHSAPLVGGQPLGGDISHSSLPTLTPHELAYLSDYMRMMGVTPPSTQQQWALLLSTISYNTPGYTTHGQNGFSTLGNGPNLSTIFGGGKSLDNTTANAAKRQIISIFSNQQPFQTSDMAALNRVQGDGLYYKSLQMLDASDPQIPPQVYLQQQQQQQQQEQHQQQQQQTTSQMLTEVIDSSSDHSTITRTDQHQTSLTSAPAPPTVIRPIDNENGMVSVKVPDFQTSSPEDRMDYLTTTTKVPPASCQTFIPGEIVSPVKQPTSPVLHAKVYGPLGFRPVSFQARSS